MPSLSQDMEDIVKRIKARNQGAVIGKLYALNTLIIKGTPVITGRARAGWIATTGSPSDTTPISPDKSGARTVSKANTVARKAVGKVYYLTNNVVYIGVLEYGGYPDPPELGSWDKAEQKYEILSVGGFSKQAPSGMVRIAIGEIKAAV